MIHVTCSILSDAYSSKLRYLCCVHILGGGGGGGVD